MVGFIDGEKVNASIAKEFIMVLYDNETFGPGHCKGYGKRRGMPIYDIINVNAATLGYANGKSDSEPISQFQKAVKQYVVTLQLWYKALRTLSRRDRRDSAT